MPDTRRFRTLSVRHFKGLETIDLEGLGSFNVLVGANDVGKTTVLEALFFLTGLSNLQLPVAIQNRRNLLQQLNLAEIETQKIGGGSSKLQNVRNIIQIEHDKGRRIALILDADVNFETRRVEVRDRIKELGLPVDEDAFFFDAESSGPRVS